MDSWRLFVLCFAFCIGFIRAAVIPDDDDVSEQGLYSKSNNVIILTKRNFERKVYGQKYAVVVQFYNSYCGHCRAFAPKYKSLATEIVPWNNIIRLAVIDCSVEENNEVCREFEVMAYPSLRYLHENYSKGNANVGDRLMPTDTSEILKSHLITKMQSEQSRGYLSFAPSMNIASYATYATAISDVPRDTLYTFLVFENFNSTVGSEIALDINDYSRIQVKRVYDTSELANVARIQNFPGLVAVKNILEVTNLTPNNPTKQNLLRSIRSFLKSINYVFPQRDTNVQPDLNNNDHSDEKSTSSKMDVVYYSDLEKTLKTSLHTEIIRYKSLTGEPLSALIDYLNVILGSYPFRGNLNLNKYITELRDTLNTRNEWTGNEVYDLVKHLEVKHAPVYMTDLEYIGCKGSQVMYRGYTCGLWTLFHTLTVNAVGTDGPKILRAMHGYVKNFFGCTECAEHFQSMAARNKIFDVKENDKAVLWLWISHNEVNLRLAGDVTEDPEHPKIQYPSMSNCPECRLSRGKWNLAEVYQYLQTVYGANHIRSARLPTARSASAASSPFSNLDIGMLSLLYIISFIMLILVIKYFLTKQFYRKRFYKHGRGKV